MTDWTDDDPPPVLDSVELAYKGAKCRACRASVVWAITVSNNRRICLDARPQPDGRVEVLRTAFGEPVVKLHGTNPPEGHVRYRVHLASCKPRSRGWRGRQQRGATT